MKREGQRTLATGSSKCSVAKKEIIHPNSRDLSNFSCVVRIVLVFSFLSVTSEIGVQQNSFCQPPHKKILNTTDKDGKPLSRHANKSTMLCFRRVVFKGYTTKSSSHLSSSRLPRACHIQQRAYHESSKNHHKYGRSLSSSAPFNEPWHVTVKIVKIVKATTPNL